MQTTEMVKNMMKMVMSNHSKPDALTCDKGVSIRIFKEWRDRVTADDVYQTMRKEWRLNESL